MNRLSAYNEQNIKTMLHVNPKGEEKGVLMIYNLLNKPIKQQLKVNLYCTGLLKSAKVGDQDVKGTRAPLDTNNNAISISAQS